MSDAPGRARTRARGRARQTDTQAEQPAAARGPMPQPAAAHPTAVTGGRKNHRGVPRSDVDVLTSHMSALEMVGENRGRGAMRRVHEDIGLDNTRPEHVVDKTGVTGQVVNIVANYFELMSKPHWIVHQYHVEFAPIVESPRVRRALLAAHKERLGNVYLFDGMSDLKMLNRLETESKVTELSSMRNTDGQVIIITVKHVAELAPSHPELGRLYNTQMRKNLQHLHYTLLGRHYFDQEAISVVPEYKLRIWQGVITSIRQQEESLMMVVDTVHKVVRDDTVLDIIRDIIQKKRDSFKDSARDELVGSIVMTSYNNRTYRIDEIMWEKNPAEEFEAKDGSISFVNYYKKQYDINIRNPDQPLLLCTSKEREVKGGKQSSKKIFLVPELCCMTGLTDAMRAQFKIMKELGRHTKLDPRTRIENLQHFINKVNNNPDIQREMNAWQMRFSGKLVELQGRVLPPEKIIQRQKICMCDPRTADFSRDMRGNPMHTSKHLTDWLIISTRRDMRQCNDFINTLKRVAKPMDMNVYDPKVVTIDNDRVDNFIRALNDNRTQGSVMVVFIVPNDRKDRYDALKKATCIRFPIPSQVIVSRTLSSPQKLMSVATKICIQMNCKLGGEPWAIQVPFKRAVMIIGFDTYHDSSRRGCSAGGFVASLNHSFSKWYSRASFHQVGVWEELSNHLKTNLTMAFRHFREVNGCPPSLILFYRDGVGDGHIRYVLEHEVEQLKQTISQVLEPGVPPAEIKTNFAFIVVNKRINTRLFAQMGHNYNNPLPGTVVDKKITRPDRYDFFLVSQSVREGTVAPTMFNVIADRSSMKPDHLQQLSYKLTHLYFNYQGTIRVPAPCQYAHKLAFLCGQSLHQEPAESLQDKLFYL